MNKKLLTLGSMATFALPVISVISCNVPIGREQKDQTISDDLLLKSTTSKKLMQLMQDKFEYAAKHKMYEAKVLDDGSIYNDAEKKFTAPDYIAFNNPNTITHIAAANGLKNPAEFYRDLEFKIWRNTYYDTDVQSLLNNIRTVYNRKKVSYPTKASLTEENGRNYANITYQIDLISPMKRRFMKKFQTIEFKVPNQKATNLDIYDSYKIASPLSDHETVYFVLDQYFNRTLENRIVREDWFTSADRMNKKIVDWSSLKFLKDKNDATKYKIGYTYYDNIIGNRSDGKLSSTKHEDGVFTKEFKNTDTLQTVANYLQEQIFTNNENTYIKKLFDANTANSLEGRIEFASLAGTSINGTTIYDYVTNLLSDNTNVLGHFNMYIRNKKQVNDEKEVINPISWYSTDIPMGKGEEA